MVYEIALIVAGFLSIYVIVGFISLIRDKIDDIKKGKSSSMRWNTDVQDDNSSNLYDSGSCNHEPDCSNCRPGRKLPYCTRSTQVLSESFCHVP